MTQTTPSTNDDQQNLFQKQYQREEQMHAMGIERFREQLEQGERNRDLSRSKAGKAIDKFHLQEVIDTINADLKHTSGRSTQQTDDVQETYRRVSKTPDIDLDTGEQKKTAKGTPRTFSPWNTDQIAIIVLRGMIDVCRMPIIYMDDPDNQGKRGGARPKATTLAMQLGARIEQQVILNQLRHYFPDRASRAGYVTGLLKRNIAERASYAYKHHNTKRALRESAEWFESQGLGILAERFRWKPWNATERLAIGNKLMKLVINGLCLKDGVKYFDYVEVGAGEHKKIFLGLSEAGELFFDQLHTKAEETQIYHLPMVCPPLPHTHQKAGGYLDIQMPQVQKLVTGGLNGNLKLSDLHLAFLNNQQSVPFRINGWLADVMEQFYASTRDGRNCGKFKPNPRKSEWVRDIPSELKGLRKGDKGYSRKRAERERVKQEYKTFMVSEHEAKQTFTDELMDVIRLCRTDEALYLPTCSDFRGRSLLRCMMVSYQGSDPHKAILEWSEGYEADEWTEFWLKIEMAGLMSGGLDKMSWEKRCAAVDEMREQIIACVRDPFGTKWWQSKQNVSKPWLWLVAAREWVRLYVDNDPNRVTHARTHVDATCSGQQYFAGLLQCLKTATQVNLIKADEPADVYSNVLNVMVGHLQGRRNSIVPLNQDGSPTGKEFETERLDLLYAAHPSSVRPGVKGCIISGQYGAGAETRTKDFQKKNEVTNEFTLDEARAIYRSIEVGLNECLPAMDKALNWIQKVTRDALEKTGRNYILLPSADGSVVKQLYPITTVRKVEVENLGSGSLKKRHRAVLRDPTNRSNPKDHIRSSPANLIHAQDGATLVLGLHDYDKPFACTHDSIAGRPGKEMWDITERMKKALYKVFTSDVLRQFVEMNGLRYKDYKPPIVGDYDPKWVLDATYPYC